MTYYSRNKEKYKAYSKRYKQEHPEWYRHRNRVTERTRRETARKEVLHFLGGKCSICGFDDWRALQLDHINGDGARDRRENGTGSLTTAGYRRLLADPETPNKFQILCANHNWIKRYENNECIANKNLALMTPFGEGCHQA